MAYQDGIRLWVFFPVSTSRPLRNSGAAEIEGGFVLIAPAIRRHIPSDTSRIDGAIRAEARRDRAVGVLQHPASDR